jgi:hypothetical protein
MVQIENDSKRWLAGYGDVMKPDTLAAKADLGRAVTELKLWLVLTTIAVAGLAIGVAKVI